MGNKLSQWLALYSTLLTAGRLRRYLFGVSCCVTPAFAGMIHPIVRER